MAHHLTIRVSKELYADIEAARGSGNRAAFIRGVLENHFNPTIKAEGSETEHLKTQLSREQGEVDFLRDRVKHLEVLLSQSQSLMLPDKGSFLNRLQFWKK